MSVGDNKYIYISILSSFFKALIIVSDTVVPWCIFLNTDTVELGLVGSVKVCGCGAAVHFAAHFAWGMLQKSGFICSPCAEGTIESADPDRAIFKLSVSYFGYLHSEPHLFADSSF